MFVETRRLAEALGADVALAWPVFLVHVQDVDAQPVSLLKRPATSVPEVRLATSSQKA